MSFKLINITDLCHDLIDNGHGYFYEKTYHRHIKDLKRLKNTKYRFNNRMANVYIFLLEQLKHHKGVFAGNNFILEDWQKAVVGISMGWEKQNADGKWTRRFNTVNLFMARKQGKTLISAGLALVDLIARPEEGSEICCVANKRAQAMIAFDSMHKMMKSVPEFKKDFHKTYNRMTYKPNDSAIYTLGRDSGSEDGLNISTILLDEYAQAKDTSLYDVARSSQGARQSPLTIIISTAGTNQFSPMADEVEYSKEILNNDRIDDNYFAFMATPDSSADDFDPFSLRTLKESNPNMNVSVSEESLLRDAENARERPIKLIEYLTKQVNIFVNSNDTILSAVDFKNCLTLEEPSIENIKHIFIGVDLSQTSDWTAITKTILYENNSVYCDTTLIIPDDNIDARGKELKIPLRVWIDKGFVVTTPGRTVDLNNVYDIMYKMIDEAEALDVPIEVLYDPWKFKGIYERFMLETDFDNLTSASQGFATLNEPLAMFLKYIKDGDIKIRDNDAITWMASNLEVIWDQYERCKPTRENPKKKIDGIAAIVNTFVGAIKFMGEAQEEDFEIWTI